MKKLIVVIMALITIFSASVTAFASSGDAYVDGAIVDTLTNVYFDSYNCSLVYAGGQEPSPNMTGFPVGNITQKTTYRMLYELYERCTVYGSNLVANKVSGTYHWIERNGYCFIEFSVDNPVIPYGRLWVGNFNGKILYCDAPAEETTYDVVAIAGTSNYFLTDRPAGTVGNGYLGDLQVTYDNWMNIKNILDSLSGNRFYYAYGHSINGEYRYYLTGSGYSQTYYVCNSAGQLFYYVKDEGSTTPPEGGGSTFDPTEVITAINSVYDAINSQGSRVVNSITQVITSANSIGSTLNMHMNNVVDGFDNLQNSFSTLNSYFTDLSGLFPVQETITLLGSDTRVAWDSADRITNVTTAGFGNGDLTIKTNRGPLIDESGYEKVTLSPDTTEYRLYNDADGYRRIVAQNEYPDVGSPAIPDDTLFYFSFDDTLSSSVGDITLTTNKTGSYSAGVNGNAFVFPRAGVLSYPSSGMPSSSSSPFTFSFWFYPTGFPTSYYSVFNFAVGSTSGVKAQIGYSGSVQFLVYTPDGIWQKQSTSTITNMQWHNFVVSFDGVNVYGFVDGALVVSAPFNSSSAIFNGSLQFGSIDSSSGAVTTSSMIDDLIFVNGECLWTSNFDPYQEAIFSEIAADYFLPCTDQTIGLVFNDTINQTLSPTDVNGNAITMGRLEDDFSEIYMDISTMMWYCHDPQTQTEILLSSANQQIMNDTIYVRQNYTMLPADQITADALQNLLPVDSSVYLDMPEGAKLTITYDHYTGWFRMMYILMDKQTKLLSDLDIVNETIINVENTVIDITNNNPAYNVFYITKTDGTTESVGDAAKDAAVFVGDILSMFYRLVFDDALDNVGILKDFEGAYSNTEVSVW